MDIITKIVNLGAFVMMPIVIFILGVCFRVKWKDSLRAGITVGIGFKGISLAASLITGSMTPLVTKLQELWGLGLDAVDLGVPVISGMAYSDGTFVLAMFIALFAVNALLLVLKVTKTLNVDIWNFWHYLFIGTLATIITGSFWIGLLVGVIYSVINLLLADHNHNYIAEVAGEQYRGLSFCTMAFPFLMVFNRFLDKILDSIPGIKNINLNMKKIPEKFAFFTEPTILGFICGVILAALAEYSWDQCLNVGMSMAAAMLLLPRMISILMEGLSPIARGTKEFMSKRFKGREFYIGMDFALLVGDPDMISLGMIFVPVSLALAVILPGNRILPLIGLTNLSYMMMSPVLASKHNMFRAFIIGLIDIILVFYMATDLTPLITEMAVSKGVAEAGGFYSIFNTGEHVGWLLLKIVEFFK